MRTVLHKILKFIGLAYYAAAVLFAGYLVYFQYMQSDARYLRDNLEYFSKRKAEAGIGHEIKTHGLYAIAYPKPLAAYRLYSEENTWIHSYYVERLESADENSTDFKDNTETSPFDALTRLYLESDDTAMQDYYGYLVYDNAQTSIATKVTEEEIEQWQTERKAYVEKAQKAWEAMAGRMLIDMTVAAIALAPIMIYAVSRCVIILIRKILFLAHRKKLAPAQKHT